MPLDPQAQAFIARFAGDKPVEQMTVEEVRAGMAKRARETVGQPQPVNPVVSNVRDQRTYGERLQRAGTPAVHREYARIHGFVASAGVIDPGVRDATAALRQAFAGVATGVS